MTTRNAFSSSSLDQIKAAATGLGVGEQTNLNHLGCPAGTDIKARLYVKVTEDGRMTLAYCHHCGQRGGLKRAYFGPVKTDTATIVGGPGYIGKEYYNTAKDMSTLTQIDRVHATEAGPLRYLYDSPESVGLMAAREHYGIRYHNGDWSCRTGWAIPYYDGHNVLVGVDIRHPSSGTSKSKWERFKAMDKDGQYLGGRFVVYNNTDSKTCVLCEDPVSAIKLDMAGFAGVSIMGTNISSEDLLKLRTLYDKLVVWLDNDSITVRSASKDIERRAGLFFPDVVLAGGLSDPKIFSLHLIRNYLE